MPGARRALALGVRILTPPAASVCAHFISERNSTTALNLLGGRFLKDGIGAVGFTSVLAIPSLGMREPM